MLETKYSKLKRSTGEILYHRIISGKLKKLSFKEKHAVKAYIHSLSNGERLNCKKLAKEKGIIL